MPREHWQPSWTPEMLDPEFAIFIFFPMATLLTLGFLLWACDGWPDETVAKRLDKHLRPKFLLGKSTLYCPACNILALNVETARRHWDDKHPYCNKFCESDWRKPLTAEWFHDNDFLTKNNVKQLEHFQVHYECNRMSVYSVLFRTSPFKVWKSVFLAGLMSFAIAWGIVNGVHYKTIDLETVFRNMEACVVLMDVALPFASVSLALYIWFRLWRFADVLNQCTAVQCALEEIALLAGYSVPKDLDEEKVGLKDEALFLLSQYLNLVHQLVFLRISKRFERYSLRDMVNAQLITEAEREHLNEFKKNEPTGLAIIWIGHLLTQLIQQEILESTFANQFMRGLAEIRRSTSRLMEEGKRLPPLSFLQLMQIAADVTCLMSPLVILYKLLLGQNDLGSLGGQRLTQAGQEIVHQTGRCGLENLEEQRQCVAEMTANDMMYRYSRATIYMIPAVGTMFVTLIYQSVLQMARDIEDPFGGIGADNLNADQLLQATEIRIGSYLTRTSKPLGKVKLKTAFDGEAEYVVLMFNPGRTGLEVDGKTGQLLSVQPGTQAWNQGVHTTWKITKVKDDDFLERRLNLCIQGQDTYSITFLKKETADRRASLAELDFDLLSMGGYKDEVASVTSSVAALLQPRNDGRPNLPTAVVLSAETLGQMTSGCDQDARDLQEGVRERLQYYNVAKTHMKQEELHWIGTVQQLLPKLEEARETNMRLREKIAEASAGVKGLPADNGV